MFILHYGTVNPVLDKTGVWENKRIPIPMVKLSVALLCTRLLSYAQILSDQ